MARRKSKLESFKSAIYTVFAIIMIGVTIYGFISRYLQPQPEVVINTNSQEVIANIPEFNGENYWIEVNNMKPLFTQEEIEEAKNSYIRLSELDSLKRVGPAQMSASQDTQPSDNEKRESISSIKPTGWVQTQYEYNNRKFSLYNRGHLLMWKLSRLNAEPKNLATMTEWCNQIVMTKFEYYLTDYLKEYPDRHILYRITPVFEGNNLVAKGFLMEAYSVEDSGYGVEFCVFIYNNEPGITIDYSTGKSHYIEMGN